MKRKLVLGFLAVQLILACVTGCGKANNSIDGDGSAAAITSAESATDNNLDNGNQGEVNGFDFDRAIKNITFEGERIQLPTTLNELGDGFSLENPFEYEMDYGKATGYDLMKNGKKVAGITVLSEQEGDIANKSFVEFSIVNEYAELDGFEIGDNIDEVKEVYGEPTECFIDSRPITLGDNYTYMCREGDDVSFRTTENGKIIGIYINMENSLK